MWKMIEVWLAREEMCLITRMKSWSTIMVGLKESYIPKRAFTG